MLSPHYSHPHMIILLIAGIPSKAIAPAAHAGGIVTYVVTSSDIDAANVEYFDFSGRKVQQQVPLPWRIKRDGGYPQQ